MKDLILENILIRYKILGFLYLLNQENKRASFKEIVQKLSCSEVNINQQMKFLEEENLIIDIRMVNGKPLNIKITSEGQRLVEEIELQKKVKGKDIGKWLLINAPWIVQYLPQIIELIKKGGRS
ncbi:MAG TPA: hypothetical protein ENG87_03760 [Candidatus Pacearchaeota archaeon]|nr:hypothetical protein BMS3Abin17_01068 [archaeon BMS3Abin17]HDK42469.1 hypothetical protein [Candidatus Pacearchaeota archaeon]HDZ61277.1 hypothetical protein [Candidatus Pacearchaeota archaeon]